MNEIIIVPCAEIGKNGKLSFSRTRSNAYVVWDKIPFDVIFGENENGFAYLTIKGLKILARLAKANQIGVLLEDFEINTDFSENIGICGEWTLFTNVNGLEPANKDDDLNGVDGYFYGEPVQIKTCSHGIEERCLYAATDKKKIGISVLNASIADLFDILDK